MREPFGVSGVRHLWQLELGATLLCGSGSPMAAVFHCCICRHTGDVPVVLRVAQLAAATHPFIPVVKLRRVWARLSTHVPTEPAVTGGEHTALGVSAAGLLTWVSPWQVSTGLCEDASFVVWELAQAWYTDTLLEHTHNILISRGLHNRRQEPPQASLLLLPTCIAQCLKSFVFLFGGSEC